MRTTTFIALTLTGVLAACAAIPPGANLPKVRSTAFDHPEQTDLGQRYLEAARRHRPLSGFRLLNNGPDGLAARLQLIDQAQAALDLQYYIYRQDQTGKLLTEHLLEAADRGVKIRILVDDSGLMAGDERLFELAAHPNIQVRIFNPLDYRGHSTFLRVLDILAHRSQLDYRMHNKLFIADGAVAMIGGRNIGDPYFQIDPESQFGDDDVFSVGPVVKELAQQFDRFWNSDHAIPSRNLAPDRATVENLQRLRAELTQYRREVDQKKVPFLAGLDGRPLPGAAALDWASARVVSDSPDKREVDDERMAGTLIYEPVVEAAKAAKSEVLIVTPFLVPGEEGLALFRSLHERHVAVRVLTNSLESTPHVSAQAGYAHYRVPMLKLGVQLFEIRADPGLARGSGEPKRLVRYGTFGLHAKVYIFDRQRIFLGSMNFDQRSMHLNTEIGLIIDSPALAEQEVERFERLTSPVNSYRVRLKIDPSTQAESLIWATQENGKPREYDVEPSQTPGRRLEEDFMSILPLDSEL